MPSGYSKVCSFPGCHPCQGPGWTWFPHQGDIHSPAPTVWLLSISPSSPYFSPILTSSFSTQTYSSSSIRICQPGDLCRCSATNRTKIGAEKPSCRQRGGIGPSFWKQVRLKFRWSCKHSWKHLLLEAKSTQALQQHSESELRGK